MCNTSHFLSSQQLGELPGSAVDCEALEEFGYFIRKSLDGLSTDDFKAICQLWSRYPSLKLVTKYGMDTIDACSSKLAIRK